MHTLPAMHDSATMPHEDASMRNSTGSNASRRGNHKRRAFKKVILVDVNLPKQAHTDSIIIILCISLLQDGPSTEQELAIRTVRTVLSGTETRIGTARTAFEEPKPELELSELSFRGPKLEPGLYLLFQNCTRSTRKPFANPADRGREFNPNIFSQSFRAPPGYPGKIPG